MEHTNNSCTAVIILNYNNWEDTINCIKSIEKYNTASIKYIIVDNGSTRERTVENLDEFFTLNFKDNYCRVEENDVYDKGLKYITFLLSKNNDGYARGNNKGLKLSYVDDAIDNVMILNNDVLFVEDIIPILIKKQKKICDCAIMSPILYKKNMKEVDYNCARRNHTEWEIIITFLLYDKNVLGYITRHRDKRYLLKNRSFLINRDAFEIDLPSGSCMFLKKTIMQELQGFDPNTFLYYEENILYKKVCALGLKNYLLPSLKCIHLGASTTSKSKSPLVINANFQSAVYYLKTYCKLDFKQKMVLQLVEILYPIKIKLLRLFKG